MAFDRGEIKGLLTYSLTMSVAAAEALQWSPVIDLRSFQYESNVSNSEVRNLPITNYRWRGRRLSERCDVTHRTRDRRPCWQRVSALCRPCRSVPFVSGCRLSAASPRGAHQVV